MTSSEGADPPLRGVSVPDDARALEPDRWRYYEELHRRADLPGGPGGPATADSPGSWRDGNPWFGWLGSSRIPMAFAIAAVLAMGASLLLPMIERSDPARQTEQLAVTSAPAGTPGALLPDGRVQLNGGDRRLRDLRPAVLALLPPGPCPACVVALDQVAVTTAQAGFAMVPATPAGISRGDGDLLPAASPKLAYPAETFDSYRPTGLTLLVVAGDGTVAEPVRDAENDPDLTGSLQQALNDGG